VSAGLVRSRVQTEVQQESAQVVRGVHVGATKGVRQVVAVERAGILSVDLDSVRLQLESVNGLSGNGERGRATSVNAVQGHNGGISGGVYGVERSGRRCVDGSGRLRRAVQLLIGHQGQSVPVAVLVGVGSRHVLGRAKSNVHGLNGPLQLRQQHVVGLLSHAHALEAMHTNQRKADALDQSVPKR
jgi:hypothetical protein